MKYQPTLTTFFGVATWAVSLAMVLIGAAGFLLWSSRFAEAQVRAEARSVAATVAVVLENGVSAKTLPIVHEAAKQPHVAFVRARASNGIVLTSAGDPAVPASLIWIEESPITYYNETRGHVEVAVFRNAARTVLLQWITGTLALALLATALSAVAAYFLAHRLTSPIQQLRLAAANWEQPDVDLSRLSGPREVMELGASLTTMRGHAIARKHELEALVSLRTRELSEAYGALEDSFHQTAAALAQALDARDPYTATHSSRTASLVKRIGERMGLRPDLQRTFVLAATIHDIGKIGVPEAVLHKPGPLTATEWAAMKAHSTIGATILRPIRGMGTVVALVHHHHERWDGQGYPDGLAGEQIPLGARIIAVADSLEAMCSRRPYREPLPPEKALAEIRRGAGTQFDPAVVTAAWPELERIVAVWYAGEPG